KATLSITNSTFSGNYCGFNRDGGGIYNYGVTFRIGNTILAEGLWGENIFNRSGTVISLGYNLSNDAAGGDGDTGPGGFLSATGDQRNTDPRLDLEKEKYNGGPTPTIALRPGSPAID